MCMVENFDQRLCPIVSPSWCLTGKLNFRGAWGRGSITDPVVRDSMVLCGRKSEVTCAVDNGPGRTAPVFLWVAVWGLGGANWVLFLLKRARLSGHPVSVWQVIGGGILAYRGWLLPWCLALEFFDRRGSWLLLSNYVYESFRCRFTHNRNRCPASFPHSIQREQNPIEISPLYRNKHIVSLYKY